jgi:hypothetical protein
MKPMASATTAIANRSGTQTGGPHGGTGSEITSSGASREMHPAVMARAPAANTEAALSRMQQFGVTSHVKTETVFPMTEGDTTFRQRATSLRVSLGSSNDLPAALAVANESLRPAPIEAIEEWLARLSVKTARRKDTANGDELALSVYTDHLRAYPGDAVRHVLSNYRGTWFPTWGELADLLDEFTEPRLMIRDRLAEMLQGKPETITEAPTLEQLRNELAALNRMLLRFPETACEKTDRLRDELLAGIERAKQNC